MGPSLPAASSLSAADRAMVANRATWLSVAVNVVLTVVQLLIGWLAYSQSLIAHGLHSLSDLFSDFLVLYASRQSAHPADEAHPYGHARVETAATLVLGASLTAIGGGILWQAGLRLHAGESLPTIAWSAFWAAVATVLFKEILYRYLIAVGQRLRSQLLIANALHTRADAASGLVVVVGIGGALAGWPFLDLLAAALMGFMILRMGIVLAWEALKELIDTGLDAARVQSIRSTLLATPGVLGLHQLRTRRMAHQALVDAHVQVAARISVSEGHSIAELARRRVLEIHPEVLDVLVHIDPEDDGGSPSNAAQWPDRATVEQVLAPLLQRLPGEPRLILHYLAEGLEVDVMLAGSLPCDAASRAELAEVLAQCQACDQRLRQVVVLGEMHRSGA